MAGELRAFEAGKLGVLKQVFAQYDPEETGFVRAVHLQATVFGLEPSLAVGSTHAGQGEMSKA